jgi:phosphoribosylglycinamide formyltransferase 1
MTTGGARPLAAGLTRPSIVMLASGNGSNAQAVIDACADGRLAARVAAVVSNVAAAGVLARAEAAGLPALVLRSAGASAGVGAGESRAAYDERLAEVVAGYAPEWVVLAGWMRILTMGFLGRFPGRVVNLHPALPGELPGTHAIERAWHEAQARTRTRTGVMVHLVPDEGVDSGPVLATRTVPIAPHDTLAELEAKVHAVEHELLVATLATLVETPNPSDPAARANRPHFSDAAPPTVPAHA